jgi:hypothetical protein
MSVVFTFILSARSLSLAVPVVSLVNFDASSADRPEKAPSQGEYTVQCEEIKLFDLFFFVCIKSIVI